MNTAGELPVAVRTSLLHRMMIVRELTGVCRAAAGTRDRRLPSIVGHDTEAAVVGIAVVLGPLDTLTVSAGPARWLPGPRSETRSEPLTIRLNDQASRDTTQCLSAMFARLHDAAAPGAPDVDVDGVGVGPSASSAMTSRPAESHRYESR